jgi:hypothetical protein
MIEEWMDASGLITIKEFLIVRAGCCHGEWCDAG